MRLPACMLLFAVFSLTACQLLSQGIRRHAPLVPPREGMVWIPGGTLLMGGDNHQAGPEEWPKHAVSLSPFWMDETEVTNAQFAAFVQATGYITTAEKPLTLSPDSLLLPGALVFISPKDTATAPVLLSWWHWTPGAHWRQPEGPGTDIHGRMSHPVTQVSWQDAAAYCQWAHKRLPTEAEWEWAARGGLANKIYPWGNRKVEKGKPRANFWQGIFPVHNTLKDGFMSTAPVKSFPPNGYGLYDMAGNVWEWCADWYDPAFYRSSAACETNTQGPSRSTQAHHLSEKVMRGGSFLCSESYCSGYRNARRTGASPDTAFSHTGFRCARNAEQ